MRCNYRLLEWLKENYKKHQLSNADGDDEGYVHTLLSGGRTVQMLWKAGDSFL